MERMIAYYIMLAVALYVMRPPTLENLNFYPSSSTTWISLVLYFAISVVSDSLWAVMKGPVQVQEPAERMVSQGIMLAVAVILMWLWPPTWGSFTLSIWIKLAVCFAFGVFYELLTAAVKKALCSAQ